MKQLREQGYDTYDGEAELVAADTVRVDDEELAAERILDRHGSRTAIPPIEGIDDIDWIDHVSAALELTSRLSRCSSSVARPQGLELGQAFSRFGSQAAVVIPVTTSPRAPTSGPPTSWPRARTRGSSSS